MKFGEASQESGQLETLIIKRDADMKAKKTTTSKRITSLNAKQPSAMAENGIKQRC